MGQSRTRCIRKAPEAEVEIPSVSADPAHARDITRAPMQPRSSSATSAAQPKITGTTETRSCTPGHVSRKAPTLTVYNNMDVQPASA